MPWANYIDQPLSMHVLFPGLTCPLKLTSVLAFIQKYTNVDFLMSLVDAMTTDTESGRPSAAVTTQIFQDIICDLPIPTDWRLSQPDEPRFSRIYKNLSFALSRKNVTEKVDTK